MDQRWRGIVPAINPAMGFINLIAADFHLHLRAGAVALRTESRNGWRSRAGRDRTGRRTAGPRSGRSQRLWDVLMSSTRGMLRHRASIWGLDRSIERTSDRRGRSDARNGRRATSCFLAKRIRSTEFHRWQIQVATMISSSVEKSRSASRCLRGVSSPFSTSGLQASSAAQQFLDKVDWKNVFGYNPQLSLPLFHNTSSSKSRCWRSIAIGRW